MLFAKVEPLALDLALPWETNPEQEKKFKRLLGRLLITATALAFIIPWLPVFEPEYEPPEVTITKTQVLLDPPPEPLPEPVAVEPPPAPPQPTPAPEEETPPPVERVASDPEPPPPPPPAKDKDDVMREQGLAQLNNQLSSLRSAVNVERLQRKNVSKSNLGQVARSDRDAFGEDVAAKRSTGIQVNDDALKQQSVGLANYRGVAVAANTYSDQPGGSSLSYLSGRAGSRDMENIRRTFEAAKSSVYSLYLQALNEHPQLAGKFIFRLVIEPDGSVSELELVTSELGLTDLERTILERIRHINFGPKEVSPTAVEYAFSFLPS